jgi:mono/diheme cytochrome c family protein
MRKLVAGAVIMLALEVVAVAALVVVGAYDVSATKPPSRVGELVLAVVQARSVERRAAGVAPRTLASDSVPPTGALVYRDVCAACHGAPGVARSEIGSGMTPRPSDLSQVATRWSDREIFWIVKHGLRLAGMPAFGPTHPDDELWDVVAFVRALPTLSARDYARLAEIDDRDAVSASPRPGTSRSPRLPPPATTAADGGASPKPSGGVGPD